MKVFYLGANVHLKALELINQHEDTIVVYEQENIGPVEAFVRELEERGRAFLLNGVEQQRTSTKFLEFANIEQVIKNVINDSRLPILTSRFERISHVGAFAEFCNYSNIVEAGVEFFMKYKPQSVYCSYTPHTDVAWIFFRTLEELGVPVIRLVISPLPWVMLPVKGLSMKGEVLKSSQQNKFPEKIQQYIQVLQGSYENAKPYYEKSAGFNLEALSNALKVLLKPHQIMHKVEKRLVYKEFMQHVKQVDINGKYAVYFLHYQPEMNTLPEAELYCDQYQALRKLVTALPQGSTLIVKEHPSTFSKRCDRRWRPGGFYSRISRLPNTQICPLDVPTFQLIDNALFVSSISGVCLTEALIRGKPAISFFSPRFAHMSSELSIDASALDEENLRKKMVELLERDTADPMPVILEDLSSAVYFGFDGSDNSSFIPDSAEQAGANSRKANCMAIQEFLEGTLS